VNGADLGELPPLVIIPWYNKTRDLEATWSWGSVEVSPVCSGSIAAMQA